MIHPEVLTYFSNNDQVRVECRDDQLPLWGSDELAQMEHYDSIRDWRNSLKNCQNNLVVNSSGDSSSATSVEPSATRYLTSGDVQSVNGDIRLISNNACPVILDVPGVPRKRSYENEASLLSYDHAASREHTSSTQSVHTGSS